MLGQGKVKKERTDSKFIVAITLAAAIIPGVVMAVLILKYSVNVPNYDQWAIAELFKKISQGNFRFYDLIAQHNESRKFFPRLIFIGLGFLTKWDVRYEMLITFALACIVSLNIYNLNRITVGGSRVQRLVRAFLANLLIFSSVQFENWFWGIQIVVFIPIACITTCISIAYSPLKARSQLIICMVLCTISTFSYANGILSWVIVFPVLLLAKVKSLSSLWKKKWLACIWIIGFISNLILYFRNYETPNEQPSFFEFLSHPFRAIQYFLCFLGSPLGWNSPTPSQTNSAIVGFAVITIFLFLCFYILINIKDYRLLNKTIGWLAIASYSVISAAIVTLGRLGFGVEQALSSKYTTFSLYLIVSLIHLIPIIFARANSKGYWQNPIILARITTFLGTLLLVLHAQTFYYGTVRIISNRWALLRGKACLLLINFEQDRCQKINIYGQGVKIRKVQKIANHLTKRGFFPPGVLQSNKVKDIEEVGASYKVDGLFESVTKIDDTTYLASGWAVFADTGKPVDAVILTYDNSQGEPVIFGVVDLIKWRPDLAETFQNPGYLESGWQRSFSPIGFPKTYVNIRAWVFNPNTAKAIPIKGIHVIDNFGKSSNATSKEFNNYQWPVASAKKSS